jgi:hypothetical protein
LTPSDGTEISWWGIGTFEAPKLFLSLFSGQSYSDPTTTQNQQLMFILIVYQFIEYEASSSEAIAIVAKFRSFQLLVLKLQSWGICTSSLIQTLNKTF